MNLQVKAVFSGYADEVEAPAELARTLRRADEFIRLAVTAAGRTLTACHAADAVPGDSCGLVLGSAFGPMETNFEVLDQVVSGAQTSPTLFSHSVFNAAAGYIATCFDIRGCSLTVSDFDFPFFRALEQGIMLVRSSLLDYCLVLQVETYSMLMQDAGRKMHKGNAVWKPGVSCWLLGKESVGDCGTLTIDSLRMDATHENKDRYLQSGIELTIAGRTDTCQTQLEAACLVGNALKSAVDGTKIECMLSSRYGSVDLVARR